MRLGFAVQLGIADPGCLTLYREGRARWQHAREIRAGFGYREFTDPVVRFRLSRWLYALCWTGTDRPSVLFDRATVWLVTQKVLLPGATALERLVARIRGRTARRLWRSLSRDVTHEQRGRVVGDPAVNKAVLPTRQADLPIATGALSLLDHIQRGGETDEIQVVGLQEVTILLRLLGADHNLINDEVIALSGHGGDSVSHTAHSTLKNGPASHYDDLPAFVLR